MVRMLSSLKVLFAIGSPDKMKPDTDMAKWLTDPLAHPVLDAMSARELGDVPFRLTARRTEHETNSPNAGLAGRF
jgi:hypothetical protein